MKTATSMYASWLVPVVALLLVVVILVYLATPRRTESVVVRITNGPTVISTQVVPLR